MTDNSNSLNNTDLDDDESLSKQSEASKRNKRKEPAPITGPTSSLASLVGAPLSSTATTTLSLTPNATDDTSLAGTFGSSTSETARFDACACALQTTAAKVDQLNDATSNATNPVHDQRNSLDFPFATFTLSRLFAFASQRIWKAAARAECSNRKAFKKYS